MGSSEPSDYDPNRPEASAAPSHAEPPGSSPTAPPDAFPEARRKWELLTLPDPMICRAAPSGLSQYADCLVYAPYHCPHALSFGYGFLCRHPQRDEIIRKTRERPR